jgi:hypothetical protein
VERRAIEALPRAERPWRLRQALAEKTLGDVFGDAAAVAALRARSPTELRALWVRTPREASKERREAPPRPDFVGEAAWARWLALSPLDRASALQHLTWGRMRAQDGGPERGEGAKRKSGASKPR